MTRIVVMSLPLAESRRSIIGLFSGAGSHQSAKHHSRAGCYAQAAARPVDAWSAKSRCLMTARIQIAMMVARDWCFDQPGGNFPGSHIIGQPQILA